MSTVLRISPYRFYFYSHEPNKPSHIHVDRNNLSAKFWLKPVTLGKNLGFSTKELKKLESLVREYQTTFKVSYLAGFSKPFSLQKKPAVL